MTRKLLFIFTFSIFLDSSSVFAQIPTYEWAKGVGGTTNDCANSIAVDTAGNVYTCGTFSGTSDFDPGTGVFMLSSSVQGCIFISKVDVNGSFVWAKNMGADLWEGAWSIAVDKLGNVYTTGSFQDTADFDPGAGVFNLIPESDDIFVSKLDPSGNFVWAKKMGGPSLDRGRSIAIDRSGNIYTTGHFRDSADFDPGISVFMLKGGSDEVFVSKLDSNGNFVWAKSMGGPAGTEMAFSLKLDAFGNIYTTGIFFMSGDFDPGPGAYNLNAFGSAVYISKLDSMGNFVWAKGFGGNGGIFAYSLALDLAGNIFVTGTFTGLNDFDPGTGTFYLNASVLASKLFVLKLDVAGNFVWAKSAGALSGNTVGTGIAIDASGNCQITGFFPGTVDFDPNSGVSTLTSQGAFDIFVLKLDSGGNYQGAFRIGSSLQDVAQALVLEANTIYVTGIFQGTVDFDPGVGITNLISAGTQGIFILKLNTCPQPLAPVDVTPISNKIICENSSTTLYATGSGTISWFSSNSSTLALASGSAFATPALSADTATYFAEAVTCKTSVSRTAISVWIDACLGVQAEYLSSNGFVTIYPNPFASSAVFKFVRPLLNAELKIYSSKGQILKTVQNINSDRFVIERESLNSGIYFFVLESENETITSGKFVIVE